MTVESRNMLLQNLVYIIYTNTVKSLRIFKNILHPIIENETCKGSEPTTPMSYTNRLKSDVARPIIAYSYGLIWQDDFLNVLDDNNPIIDSFELQPLFP